MKWHTASLRDVAPPEPSKILPDCKGPVWLLTLDQIEGGTGTIVGKKTGPASDAGSSTFPFDSGNVLYSKLRPYLNKVVWPQEPGIATSELVPLRPKPDILHCGFLTYYLRSQRFLAFAESGVAGVKMPRVIMDRFWEHRIPIPPISEQLRIFEILDRANTLRQKRIEADAKADRILPSLYYKTFGDPIRNTKKWPTDKLGNLCDVSRGASPRPIERFLGGSVPWIKIGDATNSGEFYVRTTQEHITEEGATKSFFVPEGSLILANSGVSCGFARMLKIGGCIHDGWLALLNISERLHPLFLLCYLNSITLSLRAKAPSGTQPNLNTEIVKNLQIPVPPLALQEKFASHLSILEEIDKSRRRSKLAVTKTVEALLHRAFSGDLTAKWREIHMKELLAEMERQARALAARSHGNEAPVAKVNRHAGYDMYNKAALAAYIVHRCHEESQPLGRVKLAKLYYLVQSKAKIELTEAFAKRAAGPLDDEIFKFLSLAQKNRWVILDAPKGQLKPVRPGPQASKAAEQAAKVLGSTKLMVDDMLDQMKSWSYQTLERWATVLEAVQVLAGTGQPTSVEMVKDVIKKHPEWVPKLSRQEFSDANIEATLRGLNKFGFVVNPN